MAVKRLPQKKEKANEQPSKSILPVKKERRSIWKQKWTYIIPAIILIIVIWYVWSHSNGKANGYEFYTVERLNLERTVEVTGEMKPAARLDLAFEQNGTVNSIFVSVGDVVKKGDILAELTDEDVRFAYRSARAALSAAQAKLDLELAGEKTQTIQKVEAAVEQASADLEKATSDLTNAQLTANDNIRTAEIAVQTAQNNLNNQKDQLDQDVSDAYDDAIVVMTNTLGPLESALAEGDHVVGVDDTTTNSSYKSLLGVTSAGSMAKAKSSYNVAKPAKERAETLLRNIGSSSSYDAIETAANELLRAVSLVQTYLTDVQSVLSGTIVGITLTTTELATIKTKISTERNTLSTQYASVQNAIQAITTAKLSRTETTQSLEDAYQTAVLNLNIAKTNAETSVRTAETDITVKQAALRAAEADLELKRSPPREVDLEPLRAAVSEARIKLDQAESNLNKIQITAPIDGTVSEIIPELGEQITANQTAVSMISDTMYDIECLIPEADIALVSVGQSAVITLDAYGDDEPFDGLVVSEDPDQTVIQDAVYYKSRVSIETHGSEIKPGMTANVTILTATVPNAIVIPTRAVRTDRTTDDKIVQIFKDGHAVDSVVKLGLRGDEGRIAVTDGLNEGDVIIVSERK